MKPFNNDNKGPTIKSSLPGIILKRTANGVGHCGYRSLPLMRLDCDSEHVAIDIQADNPR